ncbi:MAG: hypothetical protein IKA04_03525 [Alistipes sp.]|nr:hypothetical protein [Alistipes sp.]
MKRLAIFISLLIVCVSVMAQENCSHFNARHTPAWFREGVSYQIMPRCFSEEGTLKGAEKHLERLVDLGISVVYLIPVNVADTDMDKSKWSPRQLASGFNDPRNPYRAGDYFTIDPEYGTDQDLKDFVNKAHSLGLKVLLDLVFAHCGPGAEVIKNHPEYFLYKENGEMEMTRWNFPRFDMNYIGTRRYFKTVMNYYLSHYNVDGFRCDVAHRIPISFWEEARVEAEAIKPDVVIVAESSRPYDMRYAFDAEYNWSIARYAMRPILDKDPKFADKGGMAYVRAQHIKNASVRPKGALHWNMTENHDFATDDFENRQEKRLGNACCELQLAFSFAIDGVPFLFNGQEIAHDKRVSLFGHKDCWIDWKTDGATDVAKDRTEKIKAWAKMRKEQKALSYGSTEWIDNDCPAEVLSFKRVYEGANDVLFVGNFSEKEIKVKLADGSKYTLAPWAYVFEPQKR